MDKSRIGLLSLCAAGLALSIDIGLARADSDDPSSPQSSGEGRYGVFNLLDHRSSYGTDWFPEPFRVDDSDVGNEVRFDYEHDESKQAIGNSIALQVEKSFGLVTFEVQAPYVVHATSRRQDGVEADDESTGVGFGDISLSARVPGWQYVSRGGFFDNTMGPEIEVALPSNSPISKNSEIAPAFFDDLRLGDHVSVQSIVSLDWILGSRPQGGGRELDYGIAFGYSIEDEDFRIPRVERLTPSIEFVGETKLNGDQKGHNSLSGTVGIRAEMKSILGVQPTLGLGYIFPIDKGSRGDMNWGILASVVFEY